MKLSLAIQESTCSSLQISEAEYKVRLDLFRYGSTVPVLSLDHDVLATSVQEAADLALDAMDSKLDDFNHVLVVKSIIEKEVFYA